MTTVRPADPADLDELLRLNNDAVPAVSVADRSAMERLVEMAAAAWVVDGSPDAADDRRRLSAFVLLFEPGSAYASPNYGWFSERYARFLYVDRVVVDAESRGAGIGEGLYRAVLAEAARRGSERVTAEVNLEPPNPGSSRFHRRMGFSAVGTLRLAEHYEVEMLACPVDLARDVASDEGPGEA